LFIHTFIFSSSLFKFIGFTIKPSICLFAASMITFSLF
jgi:hypothetical protein